MKKVSEESGVRSQGAKTAIRIPESRTRSIVRHSALCIICYVLLLAFHPLLLGSASAEADAIKSKAAVVMDAVTGRVLYAKNPDVRLLPASTTKLMTALVVVERENLSRVVTVSRRAAGQPATRMGLRVGDKYTLENLLYAALMKSANDAAVALAEAVGGSEENFVDMMNRKAAAIGANDTHFVNANGLPQPGQYITAYDLAKIMRQAIRYPILKEILGTRVTEVSTEAGKSTAIRNTNKLLWSDEDLLGGKTGYTRQARHCFVCAGERANDTVIVALLGAPYRGLLWQESEGLIDFGAKVLNKTEDPVIFLSKSEHAGINAVKVSYTRGTGPAGDAPKVVKKKRRGKTVLARHKHRHKKPHHALAKRHTRKNRAVAAKKKTQHIAKSKRGSRSKQIAKKERDDNKG